ncbi:MAG: hypothetical protein GXP33_14775 [Spirochaetes bacterium]|nr:hypothetical protein [Spirochaetota bacterium]
MNRKSKEGSNDSGPDKSKKHDSFTVKKSAEEKIVFHYNRDERLSMPTAPAEGKRSRGIFKGNKTLIILFINVIVIFLVLFLFFRFINKPSYKNVKAGYRLELDAFPYADAILVSLYIKRVKENKTNGKYRISALFYTSGEPEKKKIISEDAPAGKDREIILRTKLHWLARDDSVNAEVDIGGVMVVLKRSVKKK